MARRRKSKIGKPRNEHLTKTDQKRDLLHSRAYVGKLDCRRYGFCSEKLGKLDYCVFKAVFAAKMYLDTMIAEDEVEWIDDNELETSNGINIRGHELRKTYDYKLKPGHIKYFQLNEEELKRIANIRSETPARQFIAGSTVRQRRRSRKGMVLIGQLAEELGMSPRVCRGVLSDLGIPKPERGWAWDTRAEADKVKALITGKPVRRVRVNFKDCKKEPVET